jgi:hypothetical protein
LARPAEEVVEAGKLLKRLAEVAGVPGQPGAFALPRLGRADLAPKGEIQQPGRLTPEGVRRSEI